MGIFGTSQSEEQQLRDASNVQETTHDQASSANLSAYATAEEDLNETDEEDVSGQAEQAVNGRADGPDSFRHRYRILYERCIWG